MAQGKRAEVSAAQRTDTPNGGSKTPVSHDGGTQPRWRRDGKELFYLSLDGRPMTADVTGGPTLKVGTPKSLFQMPVAHVVRFEGDSHVFRWDVIPDGKRFLIDRAIMSSDPLTVVLNWTSELQKK